MPDIVTGVMAGVSLLGQQQAKKQSKSAGRFSGTEEARSAAMWERGEKFVPLEEQMIQEAEQAGTHAEREAAAGRAGADVAGQFGIARETQARNLARYGINPASPAWTSQTGQMDTEEAIAKAGAMNFAREQERTMGFEKRAKVAGIGRGFPSEAVRAAPSSSEMYDRSRTTAKDTGYALQPFVQPIADWAGRTFGGGGGGISGGGDGYGGATFNPSVNYISSVPPPTGIGMTPANYGRA